MGHAWVLEVRPGHEAEYRTRHDEIWPEMLEALRGAGIRNYNIFRHGLTLFGSFECDDLAADPVNARWGEWMAPIMKIEVNPAMRFPYPLPREVLMPQGRPRVCASRPRGVERRAGRTRRGAVRRLRPGRRATVMTTRSRRGAGLPGQTRIVAGIGARP